MAMETAIHLGGLFVANYAMGLLTTGGFCVLAYLLVWRWLAPRLADLRIQFRRRADAAQVRRELLNALAVAAVGASLGVIVTLAAEAGWTRIYLDPTEQPLWLTLLGFPILLLIDDAWFYWVHRGLHHPAIYRHVHHEHHRSVDVSPLTSMSFHWIEPLLLTLWIVPVSMVLPIWAPVFLLLQAYGLLDNIKSHLGYELFPDWWNRSPLRLLTSSTYHNLHHTKFRGNYGVHFRFWDRMMGTELPQYEATFDAVRGRRRGEAGVEDGGAPV